jgi:hypothetical protein
VIACGVSFKKQTLIRFNAKPVPPQICRLVTEKRAIETSKAAVEALVSVLWCFKTPRPLKAIGAKQSVVFTIIL